MIRFEQVNREILNEDMTGVLRDNLPDLGYGAFFQGAICIIQRDNEMRNIVLTNAATRDKVTGPFLTERLGKCEERKLFSDEI